MIKGRIAALRAKMQAAGLDAYIIPTADFHQSEYVGDYFKTRCYMSGFTGSAGTLVVTMKEAGLWTDGRYFIQAIQELEGSGITLFRMGEEGVPTIEAFLRNQINQEGKVGFDGRVISGTFGESLEKALQSKNITLIYHEDLVHDLWEERPALSAEPAFLLGDEYAGQSVKEKLTILREKMKAHKATVHVITTLDDIAWLYNIRGNDIAYNPVVLAYTVVTLDKAYLFINELTLSKEIKEVLVKNGITIMPYEGVYAYVASLATGERMLLDPHKVNYTIIKSVNPNISVVRAMNPTIPLKAVKNDTEIAHLKNSHIKDGVAVTKFMYWLKNNIGKVNMTEVSVSDYLEELRKEQEGYIELSFGTISAYKANAAMMHYSAMPETCSTLSPEGLLLVDSGGQYIDGTTDITRTFALGPISDVERKHFTAVVRSMLTLAHAKFLYGCTGMNLDILARGPIWDMDIDYKCGTGHGVGFLLNVHEAPNGFRWRIVPERNDSAVLEAGMVTTDEPGVYIEGSHGIRIENELVCVKGEKNEYGQFMYFEPLTFAPIDLDAIDPEQMSYREKEWLNNYHTKVYEKISPYLNEDEKEWLKTYTRAI